MNLYDQIEENNDELTTKYEKVKRELTRYRDLNYQSEQTNNKLTTKYAKSQIFQKFMSNLKATKNLAQQYGDSQLSLKWIIKQAYNNEFQTEISHPFHKSYKYEKDFDEQELNDYLQDNGYNHKLSCALGSKKYRFKSSLTNKSKELLEILKKTPFYGPFVERDHDDDVVGIIICQLISYKEQITMMGWEYNASDNRVQFCENIQNQKVNLSLEFEDDESDDEDEEDDEDSDD